MAQRAGRGASCGRRAAAAGPRSTAGRRSTSSVAFREPAHNGEPTAKVGKRRSAADCRSVGRCRQPHCGVARGRSGSAAIQCWAAERGDAASEARAHVAPSAGEITCVRHETRAYCRQLPPAAGVMLHAARLGLCCAGSAPSASAVACVDRRVRVECGVHVPGTARPHNYVIYSRNAATSLYIRLGRHARNGGLHF